MDEIDAWARAQIERNKRQFEAEFFKPKRNQQRLDQLVGENRSFLRLRSYIHGARRHTSTDREG